MQKHPADNLDPLASILSSTGPEETRGDCVCVSNMCEGRGWVAHGKTSIASSISRRSAIIVVVIVPPPKAHQELQKKGKGEVNSKA